MVCSPNDVDTDDFDDDVSPSTGFREEARGGVVVKVVLYKPAGRGFDSRWCHCDFSVT